MHTDPYIYIYAQTYIIYTHLYVCVYMYVYTWGFLPLGKARTQILQARAGTDSLPYIKLTKFECCQSSLEPERPL